MTWFDWFCRQASGTLLPDFRCSDPRRGMAIYVVQGREALRHGAIPGSDRLESIWYAALFPFVAPFLPSEAVPQLTKQERTPRPLGLMLTRATANLLSSARPPTGGDVHWRHALGERRAVYIDVPHGAVLLGARPDGSDVLQLRAIFMLPCTSHELGEPTVFVALLTDPGSERPRGRLCSLIKPDGPALAVTGVREFVTQVDQTLKAPFVDPSTEVRIRERAADFLRLVLAYYCFGPAEAREAIAATSTERLRNGKPRKGESLFAMTQLQPAGDRLGRPAMSVPLSWSLTARQEVSGHFKLQSHGPGGSLRRLIWIDPYERGPEDAPIKPRALRV
jgi:hypothetical protein